MAKYRFIIASEKISFIKDVQHAIIDEGHAVSAVSSSSSTIVKKIKTESVDAVLIYISKKWEKDGLALAETIRQKIPCPIIFLINQNKNSFMNKVFKKGFHEFIFMPFEPKQFTLQVALSLRRTGFNLEFEESEERFKSLMESTTTAVMLYQNDSWILVNPAAEILTGYSKKELMKMKFWNLVHPEFRKTAKARGSKRQSGKVIESKYESKIVKKNGEERWVFVNGANTIYEGKPAGLISVVDITEIKMTDEALQIKNDELIALNEELLTTMEELGAVNEELEAINEELITSQRLVEESERQYRNMFDNVPVGIYQTTPSGKFVAANHELARILGYKSPKNLLQMDNIAFDLYTDPESRKEFVAIMAKYGEVENYETHMKRKGGEPIWISLHARTRKDDKGKIIYFDGYMRDISKQKYAEEDLRNSERRFREFAELLPQIVIELDLLGNLTFVNNNGFKNTGYTQKDFGKGLNVLNFIIEEERERTIQNMTATKERGFEQGHEYTLVRKDGSTYPVLIYSDRIMEDNKPTGYRSIVIDISMRKEVEQNLVESEERFRILHNASFGGIGIHDKGVILEANQGLSDVSGYSYDELVGMNGLLLISPDWREFVLEKIMSGYEEPYIAEGIRKDNTVYPLEIEGKQIPYHGVIARVTEFRDVTARIRTEEELKKREIQLREIAANIPGVVYQFYARPNDEYGLYYINEKAEEIFGINNDTGDFFKHFAEHVAPEYQKNFLASIEDVVRNVKKWEYEGKFIKPDGKEIWFSGISSPTQYDDEIVFNGVLLDVSEQKTAKEEHERLTAQLRQAQKMEAIGRLAGGVAHDFNNMLTAIIGNADLALLTLTQNDPVIENIHEISSTALRASELTKQLLAFSRKQIIKPSVVSLNESLMKMERMLKRIIGEDVLLVLEKESDLGFIKADHSQVEQLIVNLVVNSRDAMPRGGNLNIKTFNIEITEDFVIANPGAYPGPYVALQISDSGVGMSDGIKDQIFEPFFTTKGEKGTGLGLATVYGVVKQNKGYIEVASKEGEGTMFTVYFPRINTENEILESNNKNEVNNNNYGANETILIVEDEDSVRNLAVRSLSYYGFNVISAPGGKEALQICGSYSEKIDMVLTDAVMPGMSGPELVPKIKELLPTIKVLFMSGYTEDAIVDGGILRPDINFISKPFGPADLAQKVREVLDEL